ncbi:MAG: hypothetical protein ABIN97_18200 [Ginsengibacter sp.]
MKTFFKPCMFFLLLVSAYSIQAQKTDLRPRLFNGVENKISYPKTELEKIFTQRQGGKYQVSLPGNFKFAGTIVSSVQRYDNLKSFLIKSEVLNGAIFAVSKRINDDGTISFTGRIINDKYSDGYELNADASGNYSLTKINMNELLQDR